MSHSSSGLGSLFRAIAQLVVNLTTSFAWVAGGFLICPLSLIRGILKGGGRDLSSFPHSELMQPTSHEPWVLESEEKLWGRTQPRCVLFSWNSSFRFGCGLIAPFHSSSALDLKCMSMYFQSGLSLFYQKYYSCYLGCAIDQNEYLPSFLIS